MKASQTQRGGVSVFACLRQNRMLALESGIYFEQTGVQKATGPDSGKGVERKGGVGNCFCTASSLLLSSLNYNFIALAYLFVAWPFAKCAPAFLLKLYTIEGGIQAC